MDSDADESSGRREKSDAKWTYPLALGEKQEQAYRWPGALSHRYDSLGFLPLLECCGR